MNDNKILLKIAGISILISTSEDEEYARALADDIDTDVRGIIEGNPSASVTNAALLCAIDYLDAYRKANRSSNNLRNQIKDYLADAANAKLQFDEERKKTADLTVEIQALRSHLTRIAAEGDSSGAVDHLKADLAKCNTEINKQKKQITELLAQISTLGEKATAMNDYISGQDAEIARLNNIIGVHCETITTLEQKVHDKETEIIKLQAALTPASKISFTPKEAAEIPVGETLQAQAEKTPVQDGIFGIVPEEDEDDVKPYPPKDNNKSAAAEPSFEEKLDNGAVKEDVGEENSDADITELLEKPLTEPEIHQPTFEEIEESIFDFGEDSDDEDEEDEDAEENIDPYEEDEEDENKPAASEKGASAEDDGEFIEIDEIEKIFEEPKSPIIITDEQKKNDGGRFAFDIDLEDKPDEYFKGEGSDGMPDLSWTKDI